MRKFTCNTQRPSRSPGGGGGGGGGCGGWGPPALQLRWRGTQSAVQGAARSRADLCMLVVREAQRSTMSKLCATACAAVRSQFSARLVGRRTPSPPWLRNAMRDKLQGPSPRASPPPCPPSTHAPTHVVEVVRLAVRGPRRVLVGVHRPNFLEPWQPLQLCSYGGFLRRLTPPPRASVLPCHDRHAGVKTSEGGVVWCGVG